MSEANGDTHPVMSDPRNRPRRSTVLPIWAYLVLGLLVVGLIRFLDWIHQ